MQVDPLRRAAVYRCFAESGELLYVGMSVDPESRWHQHKFSERAWTKRVHRRTIVWFETKQLAEIAEREAIWHENPVGNRQRIAPPAVAREPLDFWGDGPTMFDLALARERRLTLAKRSRATR